MRAASSLAILFCAASVLALGQTVNSKTGEQSTSEIEAALQRKAQIQAQLLAEAVSQAGCPVVFTTARLDRPGEVMLAASSAKARPQANLDLSYSNPGGKEIASVHLTGSLKVKQSRYALDASDVTMPLTFTPATGNLGTEASIPLQGNIVGFNRLTLDSVVYKDGTVWHADKEHRFCGVASSGLEHVAK